MQNLSFEDLMGLFLISKKNSDYEEVLNINKEFERRVSKRKLMQKMSYNLLKRLAEII